MGAQTSLVALLSSDLVEVQEQAVAALCNLALHPPNRMLLVGHGALGALLRLAARTAAAARTRPWSKEAVVNCNARHCLLNLR